MKDSVFTKIIQGEIPCHKIYEDDTAIAFLDIHPAVLGHVLVVPKQQIDPVWLLDDQAYSSLMLVVKRLALHIKKVLGTAYVGVRIEGVDVPHAHVHLIPFSAPEEYRRLGDPSKEPDHTALASLAEQLRLS